VAEVAAVTPPEETEIDLDKALGLEPEPEPEPEPGLDASALDEETAAPAVPAEPLSEEPVAYGVSEGTPETYGEVQPPADAGPPPSREQTSWEKAALEQPEAQQSAQPAEQPKKKRKKISYV